MSTVSTTSGHSFNSYHKPLGEIEEDLRNEHKRSQERMQQTTEDLEASYKKGLERQEAKFTQAAEKIREDSSQKIAEARDRAKAEVETLKKETYDKTGRFHGVEDEITRDQYRSYRQGSDSKLADYQEKLQRTEKKYQDQISREEKHHQEELARTVEKARESASQAYSNDHKYESSKYDALRADVKNKYENLTRENTKIRNQEHETTKKALEDNRTDYNRQADSLKRDADARVERRERAFNQINEQQRSNIRRSYEEQNQNLRDQISELNLLEQNDHRKKAKDSYDAIAIYENDWRRREANISDQYERELRGLKESSKDSERKIQIQNNKNIQEKDTYYTNLLTNAQAEHHEKEQALREAFDDNRAEQERQLKNERIQAEKHLDHEVTNLQQQRTAALSNQAKAYEATIDRNRRNNEERIKTLEQALQNKTSRRAGPMISPAIEAALRNTVVEEYEKTLASERDRHSQALTHAHDNYAKTLTEALTDKNNEQARIQRDLRVERESERQNLLSHVQDTEQSKDTALRQSETDAARSFEKLNKSFSTNMDRQRRHYEEIIQELKSEATYKLSAQREDHEFELKNTRREFVSRQNELIRDQEKKMYELKNQYENQMEELKTQTQLSLREAEHKHRQTLDEQARAYDQRLSQSESMRKERERYLTENFQEQMERIRRSNAANAKKG